ncbi:long-chain-fatty-acid--CoA ligase [Alkalihalobacterium chitinilyticum]|uniref:Long-chain-fatty-acid--CoA ligase n=1 Tax=Alkalihalobacterium chitinilyticum TaxID=2980103 RepID=A0ABT5VKV9_9BACI|nr:long-chain-fatty-acid--CoA ligase [Alkalihalobacterium chitinilyticum]MDE5415861.1 long-chain-fatty-acid--CoA ligase [Alkalihalobacterium chitinilyticum]
MTITVGQMLDWSAQNYENKLALVYGRKHQEWTFSELDEKVNRFSSSLQKLGVKKGDVVSTFLYNTSEFVIALFAAARLGAVFNPINYRLTAHELKYILTDAKSKVLLYEEEVLETVVKTRELGVNVDSFVYVDTDTPDFSVNFYRLLEEGENRRSTNQVDEDDIYIMMYTSGTTGRPKGVLHKHRDMVHHSFLMMQCMGLTKNDIGLSIAPLNHTAELHTSFLPRVQVGATNILLHHFDSTETLEVLQKNKVSHLFAAPTMVNMLLNHPNFEKYDLSALRLLGYGGASMAPVLIKEFEKRTNAGLVQMYGTTEMGPVMTVLYEDEQLSKAGSAGKAILTHEVRIVKPNEDGTPSHPENLCEVGEVGEIIVKGPCVMKEYYQREEATKNALAYGWYHTGDLGSVDEEGYIWIRDRIDHMIVSGAENVYPREVEDRLIEHPDVVEATVIGKPDLKWGKIVTAFIVAKSDSNLTEEELDEFLIQGDKLAKYKRPREYHFVDALPKTPSGKIQKFILENQFSNKATL